MVESISKMYSRLTMTDIVDIALKKFIDDILPAYHFEGFDLDVSRGHHDSTIGQYMRGELDEKIRKIYEAASKKQKIKKEEKDV